MSGWSDIAYKAALTNPDIVVADDSTMPAVRFTIGSTR
jgi:hypothetical protein